MNRARSFRASTRRRAVQLSFVSVASGIVLLGLAPIARAGSQSPPSDFLTFPSPQVGFGGYNWYGDVKQIGATWIVPTIFKSSRAGNAATWIGAQNDNGNNFIQLGTLEERDVTGITLYQAFWSDTSVNYVPQPLGIIKAGDHVSVKMERHGFGWSLRFRDRASGVNVTRQIDYGYEDPFNIGEWVQENPSSSINGLPVLPYPSMSNITFAKLAVNGVAPHLGSSDAEVLITSNVRYRVPSSVHDDAFTLQMPTDTQLQLLNDLRPVDLESTVFGYEYAHWKRTSTILRAKYVATFAVTLRNSTRSIAHESWPTSATLAVHRYLDMCTRELSRLSSWTKASSPLRGPTFNLWSTSEVFRQYLADDLRQSLGLPPTYRP